MFHKIFLIFFKERSYLRDFLILTNKYRMAYFAKQTYWTIVKNSNSKRNAFQRGLFGVILIKSMATIMVTLAYSLPNILWTVF